MRVTNYVHESRTACMTAYVGMPRAVTTTIIAVMEVMRRAQWSLFRYAATHCNTLQHTATHCNTHAVTTTIIVIMDVLQRAQWTLCLYAATRCNTLQHTAKHCNTLQHTATHCHTLHHTRCKDDVHSRYGGVAACSVVTLQVRCNTLQHTATHAL